MISSELLDQLTAASLLETVVGSGVLCGVLGQPSGCLLKHQRRLRMDLAVQSLRGASAPKLPIESVKQMRRTLVSAMHVSTFSIPPMVMS